MKRKRTYHLYVWQGVLTDHTSGIAFAIARDADEARKKASAGLQWKSTRDDPDWIHPDLASMPEVYPVNRAIGFALYGGG